MKTAKCEPTDVQYLKLKCNFGFENYFHIISESINFLFNVLICGSFASFWFLIFYSNFDVKLLFSLATFFAFSFKRLSREDIVNDMNFKVQIFIITVKSNLKIDRYTLY